MKAIRSYLLPAIALGVAGFTPCLAGVEAGDTLELTVRGVPVEEQQKLNGVYRVGVSGGLRLPYLPKRLPVRGLNADEIATAAEKAYQTAGIYNTPAIEVEIRKGKEQVGDVAQVSVGGQVNRSGPVPYRKGLTLLHAIQAAGDRNAFGGRNIKIFRGKRVILLDFRKAEHKNFLLEPEDSVIVEQRGSIEMDRG